MPSKVTVVPEMLVDIFPSEPTENKTPVVGPRFAPRMVTTSPGDTAPGWRLAPFKIVEIVGAGVACTVSATVIVTLASPAELMTTWLVYVPAARVARAVAFRLTDKVVGVVPLVGVTATKRGAPDVLAVNAVFPPLDDSATVCGCGVVAPDAKVKLKFDDPSISVCAGPTLSVTWTWMGPLAAPGITIVTKPV